MRSLIDTVTSLAAGHPGWAAAIVFLLAAAESIAIIGAVVPGTPIIVAVGVLVALGHLNLWAILAASVLGAIAGDGLSYWIGHHYRDRLRDIWPFARWPGLLQRGEAHFRQHGARSILIARFVPVVRATVPVSAGMLGMGARPFFLANIASALVWAPAHVLPGVLAGTALASLGAISLRLALAAAGLGLAVLAAWWVARRTGPVALRSLDRGRAALAQWAALREGLAGRLGRFLAAPGRSAERGRAAVLGLTAACLLAFLALLGAVLGREEMTRIDGAVLALVASLHTEWTDPVMLAATHLGDTVMNILVGLTLCGWLLLRRQRRLAVGVTVAILGAAALMATIKLGVQAGRPPLVTPIAPGFSFPSGHSTMAVVTFGLLAWLVAIGARGLWRLLTVPAILLLILAIAFSRIYLAAHWPSDVLGGLLLGSAVVGGTAAVFRGAGAAQARGHPRSIAPMPLVAMVALLLLGVGGGRIAARIGPELAVMQANSLRPQRLPEAWLAGGWRALPTHRTDLEGEHEEPFLLQWRGDAQSLQSALAPSWQALPAWSVAALAQVLATGTPAMALPALPVMDRGRTPLLTLARPDPGGAADRRLVLRAWRSGWRDPAAPDRMLLLASVTRETTARGAGFLSLPMRASDGACASVEAQAPFVPVDRILPPGDGGCGARLLLGHPDDATTGQ